MELILTQSSAKSVPPKTVKLPSSLAEAVIGRHPQSAVCLRSISISRRHAVIEKAEKGYEIVEQNAVNGIYLNGTRLAAGARKPLAHGDLIQLGVKPSSRDEASSRSEYFVYQLRFDQNGKRKTGDVLSPGTSPKSAKLDEKAEAEKAKEVARLLAAAEAKAETEKLALTNELQRLQAAQHAQEAKEAALQLEIATLQNKQAQASDELTKKLKEKEKELQEAKDEQTKQAVQERISGLLEEQLQCSICSELMVHPKGFVCSHTFCGHCIDKWLEKKKECPVCRHRVTNATTNYLIANLIDKAVEEMSEESKLYRKNLIKSIEEETSKKHSKAKKSKEPAARGRRANNPSTSRRPATSTQSNASSSHIPSTVSRPTFAAGSPAPAPFSFNVIGTNYRIPRISQQSSLSSHPTRPITSWFGSSSGTASSASVSTVSASSTMVGTSGTLTTSQRENTSSTNLYHTILGNVMYRFHLPVATTFPVAVQIGDGQLHWVKPETGTSTPPGSSIRCIVTHVTKP